MDKTIEKTDNPNQYIVALFIFTIISSIITKIIFWELNCYFPVDITQPLFFHRLIKLSCLFITSLLETIVIFIIGKLLYFQKLQKFFFLLLFVINVFLNIVNSFCLIKFHVSISPEILDSIILTSYPEFIACCQTYLDFSAVVIVFSWILLAFILLKISGKLLELILANSKIVIIITGILFLIAFNQKITSGITDLSSYPVFSLLSYSIKESSQLNYSINEEKTTKEKKITSNKSDIPIICLIIGESASKHFMGIYNQTYDTTPFCNKLIKDGNMFAFTDVISPKSLTHLVLPLMLSFMENDSKEKNVFEYDMLVDILKEAGYQTFWLSNQGKYSKGDVFSENQVKSYDHYLYLSPYRIDDYLAKIEYPNDLSLLTLFDKYNQSLTKQKEKNFFVFHLIGSHFTYDKRFTKEFNKFSSKDIKQSIYKKEWQKIAFSQYLNSILFTDNVINEIILRIKDQNSILIYVSDHGEELGQTGVFGHFPHPSKYMVEIPMLIYMSDKCKQTHPDILSRIKESLNKPFMTDNFPHLFFDIIGIETKNTIPSKSLINRNYLPKPRIINGIKYEDLRE